MNFSFRLLFQQFLFTPFFIHSESISWSLTYLDTVIGSGILVVDTIYPFQEVQKSILLSITAGDRLNNSISLVWWNKILWNINNSISTASCR